MPTLQPPGGLVSFNPLFDAPRGVLFIQAVTAVRLEDADLLSRGK
jgi:hypothetical protein